jgi:hypothetical protein
MYSLFFNLFAFIFGRSVLSRVLQVTCLQQSSLQMDNHTSLAVGNNWFEHSEALEFDPDPTFMSVLYGTVALCCFVLIHSYVINGNKMKPIRVASDCAALSTILQSICIVNCLGGCGTRKSAILINLLANAIFNGTVQICDNYVTFSRYAMIAGKVSRAHKIAVSLYLFFLMYVTWWPYFTVVPFFVDMNSNLVAIQSLKIMYLILYISYIVFDVFYTGLCIHLLWRHQTNLGSMSLGLDGYTTLAIRACIHNVMSIAGMTVSLWLFPLGMFLQNILIVVALHFVLNWKPKFRCCQHIGTTYVSWRRSSTQSDSSGRPFRLKLLSLPKKHIKISDEPLQAQEPHEEVQLQVGDSYRDMNQI